MELSGEPLEFFERAIDCLIVHGKCQLSVLDKHTAQFVFQSVTRCLALGVDVLLVKVSGALAMLEILLRQGITLGHALLHDQLGQVLSVAFLPDFKHHGRIITPSPCIRLGGKLS